MNQNPSKIFIHYLQQLQVMLQKIERHQSQQNNILTMRLSADMLPFISQVRTAINFSLRAVCPLAGVELVSFSNDEENFAGLQLQLQGTLEYLHSLDDEKFATAQVEYIDEKAGFNQLRLPRDEFLNFYALPNFFFHLNMVYAIARQYGVPLSKGDYDGYHQYPEGFSFN